MLKALAVGEDYTEGGERAREDGDEEEAPPGDPTRGGTISLRLLSSSSSRGRGDEYKLLFGEILITSLYYYMY